MLEHYGALVRKQGASNVNKSTFILIALNTDGTGGAYAFRGQESAPPFTVLADAMTLEGFGTSTPLDLGICKLIRDGVALDAHAQDGAA